MCLQYHTSSAACTFRACFKSTNEFMVTRTSSSWSPYTRPCLDFSGSCFPRTEIIGDSGRALHGRAWLSVGCVKSDGWFWGFSYFPKFHFCCLFICLFTQTFPCGIQKGCQSSRFSRWAGEEKNGAGGGFISHLLEYNVQKQQNGKIWISIVISGTKLIKILS